MLYLDPSNHCRYEKGCAVCGQPKSSHFDRQCSLDGYFIGHCCKKTLKVYSCVWIIRIISIVILYYTDQIPLNISMWTVDCFDIQAEIITRHNKDFQIFCCGKSAHENTWACMYICQLPPFLLWWCSEKAPWHIVPMWRRRFDHVATVGSKLQLVFICLFIYFTKTAFAY